MDVSTIIDLLQATAPGAVFETLDRHDVPTIAVPREAIVTVCRALRDAPQHAYSLLSELTATDAWPAEPRFQVIYNLVSLGVPGFPAPGQAVPPSRLRLVVRLDGADPVVPSVAGVYPSADWAEREVYDLFGVLFDGHSDLRRILLRDDWEGHPLRKDYPVQVKLPVRTYEALQLSEAEFVESIQRMRRHPESR